MAHLAIAGAGAAGLFAACTALENGHQVTLIEHMDKPGKKLAITGKGRCNLTNDCDETEFLRNIRRNPRFLYSAIHALPPQAAMRKFETVYGIPLKTERGRRVFPKSDRAEDVVSALVRGAKKAAWIHKEARKILMDEEGRARGLEQADGSRVYADAVLLACGGLSYPVTGSTGLGYVIAEEVGHRIVDPLPSLVSLVEKGNIAGRMAGLSLRNVQVTLRENGFAAGKAAYREQGELLFTHFGLSGPLILSASAYLGDLKKHSYTVSIDLKPALSPEKLDARIQRDFAEFSNRDAANSLDKLLPSSMRPVILSLWGVNPTGKVNQITKKERRRLVELLKNLEIEIASRGDLEHAVITSGGVDVKQVNPKTMQSKLVPGLYFAGEILDVDGYTGGYNLQIAWSTAHVAANQL